MKPAFSLVIPCYNEAGSAPELVQRAVFAARVGNGEVILVNNGSTDDSGELLESLVAQYADGLVSVVHLEQNAGYGGGILEGLRRTGADVVGWTHADLQTDPADVLRALPLFASSTRTFAKGTRYGRPFADRLFTAGMSAFETVLMRTPLRDINAQPTLFSRELLETWGEPPVDFALDLFAYDAARRGRYRIKRFAVLFAPRRFGQSSWNVDLSSKWRFIRRTLNFSLSLRRTR